MSEGLETHDSTTPDSPTSGSDVAAPEPVNLEAPIEAQEEPVQETPEEFDEIDFEGEKYSIPRKLKDGFLMQSDYTRKTQEVAELRKGVEAERETVRQRAEAERANIRDLSQVYAIDERLTELDKTDWITLQNQDPFEAQNLFQQRTLLKERRDRLVVELQQKEQQRSYEATQAFEKRYTEANEALHKSIPNWNEVAPQLRDFAKTSGLSDADIQTLATNVPMVKLLHKAFVGSKVINAAKTTTAEPKIEPKPLQRVTGSGSRTPQTPESASDMESYVRLRRKQGYGTR